MKDAIAKPLKKIAVPVISAVAAMIIGIFVIELTGNNAMEAYSYMMRGAFGSMNNICELFVIAVPLILTGLAVTFAYRSGVFTIGVDGQLIMGAIAAAWFVDAFKNMPGVVVAVGDILTGMLVGAIWGAIAGALKAYRKVNEIVSTLLMNYIALYLADYLYTVPLAAESSKIPQTEKVVETARLPILVGGTRLHVGIIIALLCAAIVYYVLYKTAWGAKFRAVGMNAVAAECNGINVKKYMVASMAVSGAIGGLAGTIELLGTQYRIQSGFCADYGFDGIAVALIGQLNPIGAVLAALFFAALNVGSNSMELMTNVPSSIADIIQSMIIFFVVAGSVLVERNFFKKLAWKKGKEEKE
ncbi:MAG: ABC transporter permease [Roseburia sp.]|nr:ABC transporter permease [Roseburia sp.]